MPSNVKAEGKTTPVVHIVPFVTPDLTAKSHIVEHAVWEGMRFSQTY